MKTYNEFRDMILEGSQSQSVDQEINIIPAKYTRIEDEKKEDEELEEDGEGGMGAGTAGGGVPANNSGSNLVAGFTVATGLPGPQPLGKIGVVRRKRRPFADPIKGQDTLRGQ